MSVKRQANHACTSTYTLFHVTSVMLPTQAAASAASCLNDLDTDVRVCALPEGLHQIDKVVFLSDHHSSKFLLAWRKIRSTPMTPGWKRQVALSIVFTAVMAFCGTV